MALPARGIALLVLSAALAAPATAQISTRGTSRPVVTPRSSSSPTTFALEGPIDPATYVVGPGDLFAISIGGSIARQETVAVSADGVLVVPGVGTVPAAGRPLAAVSADVQRSLQRVFANVQSNVTLAVPRQFYVHVSGAVPTPGRHLVSAVGRVEDALALATEGAIDAGGRPLTVRDLGRYDEPSRGSTDRRPSLRNVRVVSRDGKETRVDLVRYFATGDVTFNPVLQDGDAVTLPLFDTTRDGVFVDGAIDRPGIYDWRPGDTAFDLLVATSGTDVGTRIASVRRTRRQPGGVEAVEVPIGEAGRLDVLPRDGLYAVPAAPEAAQAAAVGDGLGYPGTYPIEAGRTTLAALVEMAGGLTNDALVRAAYLERRAPAEPDAADTSGPFETSRPPTTRSLDTTSVGLGDLSGLSLVGRRYYAQETLQTPRVVLDVAAALRGSLDVFLEDGDRLVVPRDLGAIRVFGQVAASGYVPYREGQTAADYVASAGGVGPAATEVYVVEAGTGRFVEGPATPVLPGDAVFVARTPSSDAPSFESLVFQQRQLELQQRQLDQQDARDRRQNRYQFVQTIVAVIGTVATAILGYQALTQD